MRLMFLLLVLTGATGGAATTAFAQDMHVPSVTTADPGMMFPNDAAARAAEQRKRNRAAGRPENWGISKGASNSGSLPSCTRDMISRPEHQRMEAEFNRRVLREGKDAAGAWAKDQGRQARSRLIAKGVCK